MWRKDKIAQQVQCVPLSNNTVSHKVIDVAVSVKDILITRTSKANALPFN
jgi:hypothetical protein